MNIREYLSRKPFSIVGHRGAAGLARENTLKALKEALKAGADVVEFDVQSTRDGALVASHDDIIVSDDGGRVSIRGSTLGDLRRVRVGGEEVPLVDYVLEEARDRVGVFLEVKHVEDSKAVVDKVAQLNSKEYVAIISFHETPLVEARTAGITTGILYFKPPGRILDCPRIGCSIVLPRFNLATEKAVNLAHKLKLIVVAWTVNDVDTMKTLVARGVDAIATDYPNKARELRGKI
ncbi:MAG: glycerophosphodiester phosphodiesterase [Thermoprotei archaeon]|nr:glycerophosphodiester phosphodiesterase [Thermoprotei archaeon]